MEKTIGTNFESLEKARRSPAAPRPVPKRSALNDLLDLVDENPLFPDAESRAEARRAIEEGFDAEED